MRTFILLGLIASSPLILSGVLIAESRHTQAGLVTGASLIFAGIFLDVLCAWLLVSQVYREPRP